MVWLYVLIILGVVLTLALRFGVGKGVDKLFDSARNKKVEASSQRSGERRYLRELYPDFQPNRKRGDPEPVKTSKPLIDAETVSGIKNTLTEKVAKPAAGIASSARQGAVELRRSAESRVKEYANARATVSASESVGEVPVSIPAYQEDRCCVCNNNLDDGYAVLLKSEFGEEARICKGCHLALHTLYKSEKRDDILKAGQFIQAQKPSVDPIVADRLNQFLNVGADRLKQLGPAPAAESQVSEVPLQQEAPPRRRRSAQYVEPEEKPAPRRETRTSEPAVEKPSRKPVTKREKRRSKAPIIIALILVFVIIIGIVLFSGGGTVLTDKLLNRKSSTANDPFVGAWHDPWSVSTEFDSYTVILDNGSFMYVTNWYNGDGDIEQVRMTNDTFRWYNKGNNQYELRYDYQDGNGEFSTELLYKPEFDAVYVGDSIYGNRDTSFFINDY